jgi:hypothetical protein
VRIITNLMRLAPAAARVAASVPPGAEGRGHFR